MAEPIIKAVVLSESMIKTFNSNNRFETICTVDQITPELILEKGFDPNILKSPLTTKRFNFSAYGSLDDGTPLTISETLTKDMQISAFNIVNDNGVDKLEVTVPSFLPNDYIKETDVIYYYSADATFNPIIESVNFSSSTTHNTAVDVVIKPIFNYNQKVKARFKCNNGGFSGYTDLTLSTEVIRISIPFASLQSGVNSITFELTNEDGTKVSTKELPDAIEVVNENPQLKILLADSTAFQVHFQLSDLESDMVSYRVLMDNSKFNKEVIKDWTEFVPQPLNEIFYINTDYVVPNTDNIITIEYKDNYGGTGKGTYIFKGSYRNILFEDEEGNYFSTDTGAILKLLHIENLIAGQISTVKHIKVRNSTGQDIKNLNLSVAYEVPVEGVSLKLSKSDNPFIAMDKVDFGEEVIKPNDFKDLYVRLETGINSSGICKCIINGRSTVVVQNTPLV